MVTHNPDAGFNGVGCCSCPRLSRYLVQLDTFYPGAAIAGRTENPMVFTLWGHGGRDSIDGATIHIWVKGEFKPTLFSLVLGKAELLPRIGIIKKLGLTSNFRIRRFKIEQSEWGVAT